MDYDKTIAKVAKAYMLIWGDGRSNIAACDALNSSSWDDDILAKFTTGKGREKKLRQFDIIATNPPFAGDISSDDTLSQYELAYPRISAKKPFYSIEPAKSGLFTQVAFFLLFSRQHGILAVRKRQIKDGREQA